MENEINLGDMVRDEQEKIGLVSGIITELSGDKIYEIVYPPQFPWEEWGRRTVNQASISRFYNQQPEKGDFF